MPFDTTGVSRGPDGIKRYDQLPASLVHMLRDTVERHPGREALAETGGGPRPTHPRVWGPRRPGAGGRGAAGGGGGDPVALRAGGRGGWGLSLLPRPPPRPLLAPLP